MYPLGYPLGYEYPWLGITDKGSQQNTHLAIHLALLCSIHPSILLLPGKRNIPAHLVKPGEAITIIWAQRLHWVAVNLEVMVVWGILQLSRDDITQ